MRIKKGLFFAFAGIIVLIPVYVAISSQNVLNNGKLYKFKPLAYDPFDPFRGQYLRVNYDTNGIPTNFDFEEGEVVYVSVAKDKQGFAYFEEAFKEPPKGKDYIESKIISSGLGTERRLEMIELMDDPDFDISEQDVRQTVSIEIPDNLGKYFINEDDALNAERVLAKERENAYIAVRILDGQARLENIYVFNQPMLDYLANKSK